ncbi:class I SAM-dependent methyltransferase [Amycolatopsis suaedae]|uniref:Class I SAM-dependent methyltransferase n=1 Tax=Amycolatopsis suaedae TaxID=2510978 RepID=A0A4Q7JE01_9PSEU|nr:class I SAM-dependent methyltransferase [Amycolatopsis suaedae]RZQ65667.1 class I SAM-dependent methyltransferase [Amycolatopsis suaedae]
MLTVDFGRFPVGPGDRVLDLGCGAGRHAAEAYRRGADVVAVDVDETDLKHVRDLLGGMPGHGRAAPVRADGFALPFADATFDRVIVAEVLEHIPDDRGLLAEAVRVLRPGGLLAATVPRWWPERICWALSEEYHRVEGGHVRIYRRGQLLRLLRTAGLVTVSSHHAHALHAPFWWLKAAVGLDDEHVLVRRYHQFLCWDILRGPKPVRIAERALNPVLGKSVVVYARKP